jgi:hypothetical protein
MQFLRSGQHDDRRRRVLTDEVIGNGKSRRADTSRSPQTSDSHSYGDAASMDRQPRITDLIPRHYSTFLLLFLAGLTMLAGLEALYASMPDLAAMTTSGHLKTIDLDAEGSLATSFSSALLAAAGCVAILVYSIRRHKLDDYHGRYRVWLWAAFCWFTMAIDESGSLHESFADMMSYLTGQSFLSHGAIWWIGAYVLMLGAVGLRLLLDMRCCLTSTAALLAAALAYVVAVLTDSGLILPAGSSHEIMLEEGCEMLGNLLLLLSMGLHARYVLLDAQGLIETRSSKQADQAKKAKAKSEAAKADSAGPAKRNDLEPVAKSHSTASSRAAAAIEEDDYEDDIPDRSMRKNRTRLRVDDAEPLGDDRKLNKTDRKALRRHKEQQRREIDD